MNNQNYLKAEKFFEVPVMISVLMLIPVLIIEYTQQSLSTVALYLNWGIWIVLVAGFSPIPYKVFTIVSGLISFNLPIFILISLISRGLRFFIVSYLSYKFGDLFTQFMNKHGSKWFTIVGILIVIVGVIIYLIFKYYA